jgi:hypothetical protein
MMMDKFKNVVFLMAVVCGFVVCAPGNTCEAGDSAVSKIGSGGAQIRSIQGFIQEDPHNEAS